MRSRMIREGTVGLIILLGLSVFAGLILWLRGINPGSRSYKFWVEFANVAGIQTGTPVRYRGAAVGKVTSTRPSTNGVNIEIEISSNDLIIPRDVLIEPSQAGVLAGTAVDITPTKPLTAKVAAKPLDRECDRALIICDQEQLRGKSGTGVDDLFRSTAQLANAYSDPKLIANVNALVRNGAEAAAEVGRLSRQANSVVQEFGGVAQVAKQQLATVNESTRTVNQTARSIDQTATKLGLTADQVNGLLAANRSTLSSTLGNINQISAELRSTVTSLTPIVNQVEQGQLIRNLETLSANAALASTEFRDLSRSLNSPANLLTLQQTLDSARATFQNVEKITADLDDLTGDPRFRDNLRNLVNGLGKLVSSTQQLQQQAQLAQVLTPESVPGSMPGSVPESVPPASSPTPLPAIVPTPQSPRL